MRNIRCTFRLLSLALLVVLASSAFATPAHAEDILGKIEKILTPPPPPPPPNACACVRG